MAVIIESFATAHNGGSNQTTLTIGKPTGTVEGDLLVCFLFSRRGAGTVNNHSTLSGWTLIQTAQSDPTNVLMVTSSFYKVATDSEPDDYTWTQSESQRFCGIIMRVTGLDTANPIDVFDAATYQETPGNNLIPAPSVTPTVTNGFLVCGVGFAWNGVTFTASPPGMTEVYNFNTEQNALNAAVAVEQLTTDDPTGRRDWTATDYWSIGQSVVFRQGGTEAPLLPPANLTAVAQSPSSILVSWDAVAEADAYDVERDSVIVADKITETSYLDEGLAADTEYTYRVRSAVEIE